MDVRENAHHSTFEEQARREADAGKLRGIHSSIGQ
ncbi:MAG: hypothetical protein DK303_001634 [Chloroflexi bacterium]|jgi:hypothetical protein|nr:MAG: hypothetical protein DK303_001634 [Chloroflexota bacterium]